MVRVVQKMGNLIPGKRVPGHDSFVVALRFGGSRFRSGFIGTCECGWRTPLDSSDDGARQALNAHRAGIASARKREVRIPKAEREAAIAATPIRPTIVCLCGSTRFMDAFDEVGWKETLDGKIVLSVGVSRHLTADHGGEWCGPDVAAALDELHLRKIDLADEVLILNVGGYIGPSTANELAYARRLGKVIRFLEPEVDAG